MYEQHWNLNAKPFDNGPDVRFYFPAETHEGALLKLRYAVENRQGAALLAGAPGLGKTLLAIKLFDLLEEAYAPKIHVVFPDMPADQFICHLAAELTGEPTPDNSVNLAVARLQKFLAANSGEGRHAVIAIDEAHLLADREHLETLRLMMNFQTGGVHDLTLLLLAQPRMLRIVDRAKGLEERLAAKVLLRPLSEHDSQRTSCTACNGLVVTKRSLHRPRSSKFRQFRRASREGSTAWQIFPCSSASPRIGTSSGPTTWTTWRPRCSLFLWERKRLKPLFH